MTTEFDPSGTGPDTDADAGDEVVAPTSAADPISRILLRIVLALVAVLLATTGLMLYFLSSQNSAPRTFTEREIAQWEVAVSERPEDATAWARLAYSYAEAGRMELALETVRRGRSASRLESLILVEADILRTDRRYREALVAYDAAEGAIQEAQERAEEERRKKNVFLPLDGSSLGKVYYGRALCRIELKDTEGAIADLELAVSAMPQQAPVRVLLGELYAERGSVEEARSQFSEALRFVPDDESAIAGLQALEGLEDE